MEERNKEHINILLTAITGKAGAFSEDLTVYIFESEAQTIKNIINRKELPAELEHIAEERTVGALIRQNKSAILGADGLQVPKSIKQGDVSFEFKGTTPSEQLDEIANHLTRQRDGEIICFRSMRW